MHSEELLSTLTEKFQAAYGRPPRWVAAAPGRVNLIGEHTDYNDGFVFPMAIERYTCVAADVSQTGQKKITFRSTATDKVYEVSLEGDLQPFPKGTWANYPLGVIVGFIKRGIEVPGLDLMVHSNVPLGGGVSSSAALEVSTATLIEAVTGTKLDPVEKALLCQKAEHEYAGMPCGIMDQFISTMAREGHAMLLDCRAYKPELVPMDDPSVTVLVINTNVKHELTGSEYPTRRKQCETAASALGVKALRDATMPDLERKKADLDPVVFRRARHVITENERTLMAADAMRRRDWVTMGRLMYESHRSLKEDYEVSCAELDAVVEIAQRLGLERGVYGCRMTGGGFGGCCVALIRTDSVAEVTRVIAEEYKRRTGIDATIFATRAAGGATILKK